MNGDREVTFLVKSVSDLGADTQVGSHFGDRESCVRNALRVTVWCMATAVRRSFVPAGHTGTITPIGTTSTPYGEDVGIGGDSVTRNLKVVKKPTQSATPPICAALREARTAVGMSQTALGNELGVAQTQIVRWETTREPPLDIIAGVEAALGLGQGQLLRDAGYVVEGKQAPTTEDMIARDPRLSRMARDTILASYRAVAKPR